MIAQGYPTLEMINEADRKAAVWFLMAKGRFGKQLIGDVLSGKLDDRLDLLRHLARFRLALRRKVLSGLPLSCRDAFEAAAQYCASLGLCAEAAALRSGSGLDRPEVAVFEKHLRNYERICA